eukprot:TRINITY_DN5844_c0_g1_i1.p1 TRINITY_DN5844_c0_g1~~TRINITY_DN5844_c0_g1_i1.p1  ORF type:complete len:200 (+),score=45.56 TRINITY_DN5844_c0_g1_i1:25-624(+)
MDLKLCFLFALLASSCAGASYAIDYEYSGNICGGKLVRARFQILQTCYSFTQNDGKLVGTKITVTNNVGSQTVYENADCSGNVVSSNSFVTINNCSLSQNSPFNAVVTLVDSKLTTPASSSDLVNQYYSAQNCGGIVLGGSVEYGVGCNATKSCTNSAPNRNELPSGNAICGNGYTLPNSASAMIFSFAIIISLLLIVV